jgi:Helix-turn-helix domain
VSIEAIHWALNTASIPRDRRDASSLAAVLVGLANHAGPDGCNAFPSVSTLSQYTRLSERAVQYALRGLEELGLIGPSDPDIIAAYIKRADRRPKGWDLAIHSGAQTVHPAGSNGCKQRRHGVQRLHPNHPLTVQRTVLPPDRCAANATDARPIWFRLG